MSNTLLRHGIISFRPCTKFVNRPLAFTPLVVLKHLSVWLRAKTLKCLLLRKQCTIYQRVSPTTVPQPWPEALGVDTIGYSASWITSLRPSATTLLSICTSDSHNSFLVQNEKLVSYLCLERHHKETKNMNLLHLHINRLCNWSTMFIRTLHTISNIELPTFLPVQICLKAKPDPTMRWRSLAGGCPAWGPQSG